MKSTPLNRIVTLILAGGMCAAGAVLAQPGDKPEGEKKRDGPPPPPPGAKPLGPGDWRPGDERGDRRGGGDRHMSGGKGFGGRPPMYGEGFEKLTDDQKRRVREALAKAWGRPEVSEARDRMMKANDEMRDAIHGALKEIDPEIATLLASMRGPEPWGGGRGDLPKLPPPESDDYPEAVVKRLELEMLAFTPPERREEARKLHGVLLGQPEISAAIRKLNEVPVPERMMAVEGLRRLYREGVGRHAAKYREKREGENKEFRRPPEEAK